MRRGLALPSLGTTAMSHSQPPSAAVTPAAAGGSLGCGPLAGGVGTRAPGVDAGSGGWLIVTAIVRPSGDQTGVVSQPVAPETVRSLVPVLPSITSTPLVTPDGSVGSPPGT